MYDSLKQIVQDVQTQNKHSCTEYEITGRSGSLNSDGTVTVRAIWECLGSDCGKTVITDLDSTPKAG